jgi:hypothetical protein
MKKGSSRMQDKRAITWSFNFAVMLNLMLMLKKVRLEFLLNNTVHLQQFRKVLIRFWAYDLRAAYRYIRKPSNHYIVTVYFGTVLRAQWSITKRIADSLKQNTLRLHEA